MLDEQKLAPGLSEEDVRRIVQAELEHVVQQLASLCVAKTQVGGAYFRHLAPRPPAR